MANLKNIYEKDFNVKKLSSAEKKKFMKNRLKKFPVAATIIFNIITFGIFGLIYFGINHGRLPKITKKDFGAAKAILFLLIPIFNIYWVFRFWIGLYDRLNFQLKLRNKKMKITRNFIYFAILFSIAGNLLSRSSNTGGFIIEFAGFAILVIVMGFMQEGINKIAKK